MSGALHDLERIIAADGHSGESGGSEVDLLAIGRQHADTMFRSGPSRISREKHRDDPIVADLCAQLQKTLRDDWLGSARETRRKLLALVWDRAVESKSVWQVAGAFKIIDDSIRTEEAARKGGEEGQAPGESVFRMELVAPVKPSPAREQ